MARNIESDIFSMCRNVDNDIIERIVDAAVTYEDIINAYRNDGPNGVKDLFERKNITRDETVLEKICDWLESCNGIKRSFEALMRIYEEFDNEAKKITEAANQNIITIFKKHGENGVKKLLTLGDEAKEEHTPIKATVLEKLVQHIDGEVIMEMIKKAGLTYEEVIEIYENHGQIGIRGLFDERQDGRENIPRENLNRILEWLKSRPEVKQSIKKLEIDGAISTYIGKKIITAGLTCGFIIKTFNICGCDGVRKLFNDEGVSKNIRIIDSLLLYLMRENILKKMRNSIPCEEIIDIYENHGQPGVRDLFKKLKIDEKSLNTLLESLKSSPEVKQSIERFQTDGAVSAGIGKKILKAGLTCGFIKKTYRDHGEIGVRELFTERVSKHSSVVDRLIHHLKKEYILKMISFFGVTLTYEEIIDRYENDGQPCIRCFFAEGSQITEENMNAIFEWLKISPDVVLSIGKFGKDKVVSAYIRKKIIRAGLTRGFIMKTFVDHGDDGVRKLFTEKDQTGQARVTKDNRVIDSLLEGLREENI